MGELDLAGFVANAGRKKAILDTNLLLVQVTALTDPKLFGTFERTRNYTFEDALFLGTVLDHFKSVVTTSYVLAEVSNLANKLTGLQRDLWYDRLATFADLTEESHVPTQTLSREMRFELVDFGITDSALAYLCKDHVLITADYPLSGRLQDRGMDVLHFNHVRPKRQKR